jgi:hypothetical protein
MVCDTEAVCLRLYPSLNRSARNNGVIGKVTATSRLYRKADFAGASN